MGVAVATISTCDRCGVSDVCKGKGSVVVPPKGWGRAVIAHSVPSVQAPYCAWATGEESILCSACLEHVEKVLASVGEVA